MTAEPVTTAKVLDRTWRTGLSVLCFFAGLMPYVFVRGLPLEYLSPVIIFLVFVVPPMVLELAGRRPGFPKRMLQTWIIGIVVGAATLAYEFANEL